LKKYQQKLMVERVIVPFLQLMPLQHPAQRLARRRHKNRAEPNSTT